jgi:hypothetical protein
MSKLLKVLAACLLFPGWAASATGTSTAAPREPRQIADDAMKFVASEDLKGLFEYIGRNMAMDRAELNKIRDSVIEQRKKIGGALGKSLGFAFISECRRSDVLVRLLYAEKREKNVMRWQFIFYKARNSWTMVFFHWDNKVPELFEPCS